VLDLHGGHGDAVEVAGVVGAAGAELAADGPPGELDEETGDVAFGLVALVLVRVRHQRGFPSRLARVISVRAPWPQWLHSRPERRDCSVMPAGSMCSMRRMGWAPSGVWQAGQPTGMRTPSRG